ncbi:MAG: hypothetical protein ACLSTO_01130 [Bilophila wadsworthia]
MGDAQREAYARGLGIDPSLIPMLTRDVSGLRDMFRSLYATAGTDAAKAAEDGKGFLTAWRGWRACATCWRRRWRFRCWARPGAASRRSGMRSWRISTTSGACWSLWSRLPRRRPGHRRGARPARLVGRAALRACSGRWTRISSPGSARGSRPSWHLRGAGRGDHRVRQPQGSVALLTAAFSANSLPPAIEPP